MLSQKHCLASFIYRVKCKSELICCVSAAQSQRLPTSSKHAEAQFFQTAGKQSHSAGKKENDNVTVCFVMTKVCKSQLFT